MDDKKLFVTKEGLKKIEDELADLKNVRRKEIAERISEAKELGDLSENAEYHDAKDQQGINEMRITELEQKLKNYAIIEHKKNSETVQIGSTVTIKSSTGDEMTFTIVGASEADPAKKLISNESPLGQSLLDQRVDTEIIVSAPGGDTTYSILSVE